MIYILQAHLAPENETTFDFQKYISRSLEKDFKVVVGIRFVLKHYNFKVFVSLIDFQLYYNFNLTSHAQSNHMVLCVVIPPVQHIW